MRFELAGELIIPEPLVVTFTENGNFDLPYYLGLGYTHFDVIVIGGGGGRGGGITGTGVAGTVRNYGGAGGGGGFCRAQGLLTALPYPDEMKQVVVGAGGALGTDHASNPALTTDGGPGGWSSFAVDVCRASGGEGGHRAESNSVTVSTGANGGDGGIGGRIVAGGGAPGGVAGVPTATGVDSIPGENGLDGTIENMYDLTGIVIGQVGQGGGGGAGGIGKYGSGGITCMIGSAGGRGSYNPGDLDVYGQGDPPTDDPPSPPSTNSGADAIVPGSAGGAKATPLDGMPYIHGKSCQSDEPLSETTDLSKLGRGRVTIRLTAQ